MPVCRIWPITETISVKNSRDRTSTTAARREIPSPVRIMAASVMSNRGGRLSPTYQLRSSSAAAARVRPGHAAHLLHVRAAQLLEGAEMLEEGLRPARADAGHGVQHGGRHGG